MSDDKSSATPAPDAASPGHAPSVDAFPLLPTDPPRIGDWWLDARLVARASGVVFLAHGDTRSDTPSGVASGIPSNGVSRDRATVMVVLLSQGAAGDAAARDRLAGEVNRMSEDTVIARGGLGQDQGRLGKLFHSEAQTPVEPGAAPSAPWTVLAWDGSTNALAEADRLLRSVDLSGSRELGTPAGPGFALPWITHSRRGNWRSWPLGWPDRKDRTGWVPLAVSWLLMILAASLALLIAALIFQNAPTGGGGGGGGESSQSSSASGSSSASSSESSGSASPSESPSGSGSESGSASPSSGQGSPTKTPSMNAPGQGSATSTQTSTPQQSRL